VGGLLIEEEEGVLYYSDASRGTINRIPLLPPPLPQSSSSVVVVATGMVEPRGEGAVQLLLQQLTTIDMVFFSSFLLSPQVWL